ncbi:AAA family ATPase [Shewanella sp. LC6]|uniref:AAA family ATPase n=1 Tax=unclassified Shewanella TaxID=196818 RepID=UPI0011264B63|nr:MULTISPECIES: AAA family ATPase [unclassified Shewanella]QQK58073.1 AAA family ATPase [Shewanella sp. LC6]TPE58134.1 AAA family ATPase [Shewanella sp. LC2]
MRLLSLSLTGRYKGLKDQAFDFSESIGQAIALVGLNGSGKSQLLELIAECFAFLERAQRPDFKVKTPLGFGFTLEYQLHDNNNDFGDLTWGPLSQFGSVINPKYRIEVAATGKAPKVFACSNGERFLIPLDALPLPRVVGYSSGLNENLQRSFLKNANQLYEGLMARAGRRKQLRQLNKDIRYRNDEQSQQRYQQNVEELNQRFLRRYPHLFAQDITEIGTGDNRITYVNQLSLIETALRSSTQVYLDYDSAQLAIASLAISNRQHLVQALEGITFNSPALMKLEYDLKSWVIEEDLTRDIKKFIGDALPYNVEGIGPRTTDEEYDEFDLEYLRGKIELNFRDGDVTRLLLQSNLDSDLRMFERLYRIQQLGLKALDPKVRSELKNDNYFGPVKKPLKSKLPLAVKLLELADRDGRVVSYDDLSDGEAQLLQVLAILTLYKDEQTLFLFDEPETHLNPAWRTHFYRFLQQALGPDNENGQVFVATHSPFMISSLHQQSVFMFKRNEDRTIGYRPPSEETYGASFDVLIKQFFGLESLISHSVVEEIRRRIREDEHGVVEWLETLGKSPEKAYLIKKLGS